MPENEMSNSQEAWKEKLNEEELRIVEADWQRQLKKLIKWIRDFGHIYNCPTDKCPKCGNDKWDDPFYGFTYDGKNQSLVCLECNWRKKIKIPIWANPKLKEKGITYGVPGGRDIQASAKKYSNMVNSSVNIYKTSAKEIEQRVEKRMKEKAIEGGLGLLDFSCYSEAERVFLEDALERYHQDYEMNNSNDLFYISQLIHLELLIQIELRKKQINFKTLNALQKTHKELSEAVKVNKAKRGDFEGKNSLLNLIDDDKKGLFDYQYINYLIYTETYLEEYKKKAHERMLRDGNPFGVDVKLNFIPKEEFEGYEPTDEDSMVDL